MSANRDKNTTIEFERSTLRWAGLVAAGIALLVMVITLVVTPGFEFNTVSYSALGVVIVGLAAFVLLDPDAIVEAITGQKGQFLATTYLLSIFFVAAIIAIFVVIREAEIEPIDLAKDSEYKLSDSSKELLGDLEEPVEILAFYPSTARDQRDEAEIWLSTYERESDGIVTYQFIDPNRNPALAAQYGVTGGNEIIVTQGDRDADVLSPSERNISRAILQVLIGEPRSAYVVTGHGERDFAGFQPEGYSQFDTAIKEANFTVSQLNLASVEEIPDDADLVIIAGPVSQFVQREIDIIDAFLEDGGGLIVLADPGSEGFSLAGGIRSIDFSPDGDLFATGGSDSTAKIWDADSFEEITTLRGHAGEVLSVAFSPSGDEVATLSADGTTRVWDVGSGDEVAQVEGHPQSSGGQVAYSPDGSLLASVGEDQILRVWNTSDYSPAFDPVQVALPLYAVAFSPDGFTLAAGGGISATVNAAGEGRLYGFDAASGAPLFDERVSGDVIFDIGFLPEEEAAAPAAEEGEEGADTEAEAPPAAAPGGVIQAVGLDGSIGTFDVASQEGSTVAPYGPTLTTIAVAPDGTRAFGLANAEGISIRLWPEGATSDNNETVLQGPTDIIWALAFSPDGETVGAVSRDGNIRLYDTASGQELTVIEGPHATIDPLYVYLEQTWGIRVNNDVVVDVLSGPSIGNELTPVIREFSAQSSITEALADSGRAIFMILGHSVVVSETSPENIDLVPLAFTTGRAAFGGGLPSWAEQTDPFTSQTIEFNEGVDIPGPVTVAASAENLDTTGRLVVIGDSDIIANSSLNQSTYSNDRFVLNAANWATESEDVLDLPDPDFETREFDQPLDTVGMGLVLIASVCLVPGAVLVGGVITWTSRRRRR